MEKINTAPMDNNNYLYVNDSNMTRSSSQTFSPLRPNLPQELFKKTTSNQNLVKHIINNKILHSRMNSGNCSPNPNHMHSYSDLCAAKSPYSPSQFSPSYEGNKLSKELSNISTDTLINMDENEIEHSLLEIEILKSKLMGIKMANGNKTPNYEPDQSFIDNSMHQSNISSNINTKNNITNSSTIDNNYNLNKAACDSNESTTTKFYVDVDDDDDYDNNDDDDDDIQSNNTTPGKKKDYMEDLHMKILSEKNSPSKSSKLSENYVNDSDDINYFDIHREEKYDKNKTIYINDYKSPEPIKNKNITLISKCENFKTTTIDLSTKCYLGRNNSDNLPNFIVFNSLVVSRHHAEIFMKNNNFYIIDVGSNGGTYVNKKRINKQGRKSEPVELKSGDIIQLGQDYVENDRSELLTVYKSITFEVSIPKSTESGESKYSLNSIINIYSIDEKNKNDLRQVQSESTLSKRESTNYNNITHKREKTKELYDSKLIDESTKYQLELYEKTKDLNEENSIVNSHLLDSLKEEVCLQFFFVIYCDRKKLKRIQILNENTECIFEISLKDWLNKR
ncbi:FHA-domain-containing protein [Neocallimastix californiae]|uniref:FHA-domain-containing protein n=1 Tax=Neocallimastix californiae TaxID=1754190 RepID=A0A1Y2D637_9FUNG|nr:FHA-domain-containing protein [Neocallimastix californiae]|eukprot:ORY54667.1 FHA-domain-containing protein [Neocallimastix californiae]